jgi:hypothetical protein
MPAKMMMMTAVWQTLAAPIMVQVRFMGAKWFVLEEEASHRLITRLPDCCAGVARRQSYSANS